MNGAKHRFALGLTCFFLIGITVVYPFLLYTPNAFVTRWREWYIETAMGTMTHQWLATWFIPENIINEVMTKRYLMNQKQEGIVSNWDGAWEETLDEGDVYGHLAETLGLQRSGGKYVKYLGGNRNRLEYAIDRLSVSIRNAPLAPSDPKSAQRFEADAILRLEVPVRFSGRILPSLVLNLKVQAGYTEVF